MTRLISLTMVFLIVVPIPAFADCWTAVERRYFAEQEMDGHLVLSFKDANGCGKIAGSTVDFLDRR